MIDDIAKVSTDDRLKDGDAFKACCAAAYDSAWAHWLLGDSFHPGGLDLTRRLCDALELKKGEVVVDLACGNGASLREIERSYGVLGIGVELTARERDAENTGIAFILSDVERLAMAPDRIDVVLMECALSTFPNKPLALAEAFRVLRPGGRLGVSDVVVEGPLPERLQGTIARALCLSDATSEADLMDLCREAGFIDVECWDESATVLDLLDGIWPNLLILEVAAGLGKVDVSRKSVESAKEMLRAARMSAGSGALGYRALSAVRPHL